MNTITKNPSTPIEEFYSGQSIFVTGVTGFLGRILIEKILRSCPDVREIFLLMRPKKGLNINERLEKILNLPLYDRLRQERPLSFEKLIPVSGDISAENLGLSPIDKRMLTDRVTIVIHLAANVKFNDSLKCAVLTNTRSTRDICILAESMKNLVALIYVGTAFTQIENPVIEEKIYPPVADWREMIKLVESVDEHILNIFTSKCLDNLPNTYIFSKNLAESIIQEYSSSIPCAIIRPSIVVSTVEDPFPGWIDNFNGPMGLLVGVGKGILRVVYINGDSHFDFVPADQVVKSILLLTWKLGLNSLTPDSTPLIINCTNNGLRNLTYRGLCDMGCVILNEILFEGVFWAPPLIHANNSVLYYVLVILLHMLPAMLIDVILRLSGRQPMLVKLQRQIYVANYALRHFMLNEWNLHNTNFMALSNSYTDRKFSPHFDFDTRMFVEDAAIGIKKFLLHEDMNRLEELRVHRKRVFLFVQTVKTIIAFVALWMVYKWTRLSTFISV